MSTEPFMAIPGSSLYIKISKEILGDWHLCSSWCPTNAMASKQWRQHHLLLTVAFISLLFSSFICCQCQLDQYWEIGIDYMINWLINPSYIYLVSHSS